MNPARDAIVVGAGPAGCQAAWHLHRAGQRVLLVDRHEFPRHKSCGGMLSPEAARLLPFNVMQVARGASQCTLVRGQSGDWRTRRDTVWLTDRQELDYAFWRFVIDAGVEFRVVPRITRVKPRDGYCDLHFADRSLLRAKFVVAADGSASSVRRLACPGDTPRHAHALEADLPVAARTNACPVGFDFSGLDDGYAWYFPKGAGLNVGIARFRAGKLDREAFGALLARFGPEAARSVRVHGAPLSTFAGNPRFAEGRVLFAGDAAGLVDPVSGEGIAEALLSGRLAARAIVDAPESAGEAYANLAAPLAGKLAARLAQADGVYGGNRVAGTEPEPYG